MSKPTNLIEIYSTHVNFYNQNGQTQNQENFGFFKCTRSKLSHVAAFRNTDGSNSFDYVFFFGSTSVNTRDRYVDQNQTWVSMTVKDYRIDPAGVDLFPPNKTTWIAADIEEAAEFVDFLETETKL